MKGQRGQALPLALMVMMLGALYLMPFLRFTASGLQASQFSEQLALQTFSADAGIEDALWQIQTNASGLPNGPDADPWTYSIADVNGVPVNVTIAYIDSTPTYKITATVTGSGGATTIESYVSVANGVSVFEKAMVSLSGNITLSGEAEVEWDSGVGEIYANGNINLSGDAEVEGNATATGQITTSDDSTITGTQTPNLNPPLTFPPLDTSVYLNAANQGTLISGDLIISGSGYYDLGPAHITGDLIVSGDRKVRLGGTVYVDGQLQMSGDTRIEGPGTFVAEGDLTIRGDTRLQLDDTPVVISVYGDITVSGDGEVTAVLYAPNGDIYLGDEAELYGAVVGNNIFMSDDSELEYPSQLTGTVSLPDISTDDELSIGTYSTSE